MKNLPKHVLAPPITLLCKLGSIAVHAQEMTSADWHAFDKVALDQLLADPEVTGWLRWMDDAAFIPKKRKENRSDRQQ